MSLPTSSAQRPAASAAAPPPLEPPGERPSSHGFTVRPKIALSDCQSASSGGTFVLPITTAPAARTRAVAGASCWETNADHSGTPHVVRSPATLIDSFSVIGRPRSAPRLPRLRAASAALAWACARSKSRVTTALSVASWRSIRARWTSRSSTAEIRRRPRARSMSRAVANGASVFMGVPPYCARRASLICIGVREAGVDRGWPETGARRSLHTGREGAERGQHDLTLPGRVRLARRARDERGLDARVEVASDVARDLLHRAADDEIAQHLLGHGGDGPLAVPRGPGRPHRRARRAPSEPLVERLVDGNVEVGGDVAAHRDVGLRPGRVHVDQETRRDLDRRGITPGRARGVPHDRDRLRHVLDREPVEDGAVGHLAGDPEHTGPERRDVDGDGLGGWSRQPEAVHAEGLAPKHDALAGERLAEDLRHLAHARRGPREGPAGPGLDHRLGACADAEADAPGRDVGEPGGRGG